MSRRNLILIVVLLVVAAAVGVAIWNGGFTPTEERVIRLEDMDELHAQLAERAGKRIGGGDDFQVQVTNFAYPIGTLVRSGGTVAVDRKACLPTGEVAADPGPNLFPNYALTQDAALALGLSRQALRTVAEGGANVDAKRSIQLSFEDVVSRALSDAELEQLAAGPACRAAIARGNLLLVRGHIEARRSFVLGATRSAGGSIGGDVGNVTVSVGHGGEVTISDKAPTKFLQVVSAVSVPDRGAPVKLAKPAEVIKPMTDLPAVQAARIYVQRDKADTPDRAAAVLASLREAGFAVVPQVEALDRNVIPVKAQVRYFNDGDKPQADRAAARLRAIYPDIAAVKIGAQGPPNQLEVWMPRVADSR